MSTDCRSEWRMRCDRDERFRRAWMDAAEELRRFNAEEEPVILAEEAEEEPPPPTSHGLKSITRRWASAPIGAW